MDKRSITIDTQKHFAKLNTGEASFVRIDYPKTYLKKLEEAVKRKELPPADRLGLLRDTFALAQSGGSQTTLALELARSYKQEEDYTVWLELTAHLNQLDSLLFFESFYKHYKSYGRELYKEISNKLGWEKKKGEKHTDALLRGIIMYRLGSFGDKETIKIAQNFFGKKIDPDLRGVVYQLVAENGEKREFDTFLTMYKDEDNQQEKERIGKALGRFGSKILLSRALEFAISKHVRFQNTLGIIASVWANPTGRYLAWEFVKKNWKLFRQRYAGSHYFTRVFTPAGGFTRREDAKDIEDFIKKNPMPEAQRTIAQTIEQILANEAWLKRDSKALEKMMKN